MAKYNNSQNNINLNTPVKLSGAGNITAVLADYILAVDDTTAARTVTLPTASTTGANANLGKIYLIKDQSGLAGTNNITIVPATGTIDGAVSILINSNYGEVQVYSDGSNWFTGSRSTAASAEPMIWSQKNGGGTLEAYKGFFAKGAASQTFLLPVAPTNGEIFGLTNGETGDVTITQNSGQSIIFGNSTTTTGTGGSLASSSKGDAIQILCITNPSVFMVFTGAIGNWTVV